MSLTNRAKPLGFSVAPAARHFVNRAPLALISLPGARRPGLSSVLSLPPRLRLGEACTTLGNRLPPAARSVRITTVYREKPPPPATIPPRIAAVLHVVRVLLSYGRHLADTVSRRAAAPGFGAIAACFGTANLALIVASLHRGILRAAALERVLLARAASGHDIRPKTMPWGSRRVPNQHVGWEPGPEGCVRHDEFAAPRNRAANRPPDPPVIPNQQAATPAPCPAAPRLAGSLGHDHPANLHTLALEQLEAQVRRRPLGRTIVDICLDLAVVPGLCTGAFWNELFDLTRCHGGSIASLVRERCRREQAFSREQDTHPAPPRNWSNPGRQTIRQVLGFFIGEDPVAPFALSAPTAGATGPP